MQKIPPTSSFTELPTNTTKDDNEDIAKVIDLGSRSMATSNASTTENKSIGVVSRSVEATDNPRWETVLITCDKSRKPAKC